MPELPEVEEIARELRKKILGRRIAKVSYQPNRIFRLSKKCLKEIEGLTVRKVSRRGKFLSIGFDGGALLLFHLGMTGQIFVMDRLPEDGKHIRLSVDFEENGVKLFYRDARQFGIIRFLGEGEEGQSLSRLGPDPFQIGAEDFTERVKHRQARIKPLLLDQRVISGLGNIYVDETLFRAGIHPKKKAGRISRSRLAVLHRTLCQVLEEAMEWGGSTISDYVKPDGSQGRFQERHQVYGKGGQPCPRCGRPIRKTLLAGRGTSYCPRCQR